MKKSEKPVVVEQSFNVAPVQVWAAITDVELMRQWYFDNIPDFRAEVGFETGFTVISEDREFPHIWKVTVAEPLKRLVYDWRYDVFPGDSFVVWEIFADGDTTTLRLTATVREDFPDDVPEFTRESCRAGWEFFVRGRLREFLESQR